MKPNERVETAAPRTSFIERLSAWWANKRGQLLRLLILQHRIVIFVIIMGMLVIELGEHGLISIYGERIHFWYDIVIYLIIMPIVGRLITSLLETTDKERNQAIQDSKRTSEFSQRLGKTASWDDLVGQLVSYAHQVAPQANATLFVYNPATMRMEAEVSLNREGALVLKPQLPISPDSLPIGSLPQLLLQTNETISIQPGLKHPASGQPDPYLPPHRYDLPINRSDQQIGVLKLEYQPNSAPSQSEIRALKSAAPVMALALEGALLQNMAAQQAAASEAQRQQVAQNLHDTLAQNISYLRLKLDQLTGENAILEIGAVLQELERMRATADEAYQQVRNTLDELNPSQTADLTTMLVKQAHTISKRANYNLRVNQVGTPFNFSADTRQQVLYIIREALHNVEKHAKATEVQLQFLWLEAELIIKVTDNGTGFDPRTIQTDGHYGLWIMQHRALEVGGTLKIAPADTCGTEVTLWIPRPGRKPETPEQVIQGS